MPFLLPRGGCAEGVVAGAECTGPSDGPSCVLPEADQVALGVGDVGAETHVAHRLATDRHRTAQLFDAGQRVVEVLDADGDHRAGDRALPGEHAAVDPAGL